MANRRWRGGTFRGCAAPPTTSGCPSPSGRNLLWPTQARTSVSPFSRWLSLAVGPKQRARPTKGRALARVTTLIPRLPSRRGRSVGYHHTPAPLTWGEPGGSYLGDSESARWARGSGGIFTGQARVCFHRTRLAERPNAPVLVSVVADANRLSAAQPTCQEESPRRIPITPHESTFAVHDRHGGLSYSWVVGPKASPQLKVTHLCAWHLDPTPYGQALADHTEAAAIVECDGGVEAAPAVELHVRLERVNARGE